MQGFVQPFRIAPQLGPQYFKTYGAFAPLASHWRPASCEEYECEQWREGWVTVIDLSADLGQAQAEYLRHDRSRRCHEQRTGLNETRFVFGPGQACFRQADHRVGLGRPAIYRVSGGDYRGNPRGVPVVTHRRVEDWVDDFANHQNKIAHAIGKG